MEKDLKENIFKELKIPQFINNTELENFESKVDIVMKLLKEMNSVDKETQNSALEEADRYLGRDHNFDDINEENFIVKCRYDRTVINKAEEDEVSIGGDDVNPPRMEKYTFMQELEEDANKRAEIRKERENIAQNFRKLGNDAYHNGEYEKAIDMYTKGIDHVKDSPILFNNRALCYIKLKIYKLAIMDCDHVIHKLDDKNLRAWLYRAIGYYCLNDDYNFNMSVKMAKKTNSKEIDYIDKFIQDMKNLV